MNSYLKNTRTCKVYICHQQDDSNEVRYSRLIYINSQYIFIVSKIMNCYNYVPDLFCSTAKMKTTLFWLTYFAVLTIGYQGNSFYFSLAVFVSRYK